MVLIPVNFEHSVLSPIEKFFDFEDMIVRPQLMFHTEYPRRACPYLRPRKLQENSRKSNETKDSAIASLDEYKVNLDVRDFQPEEVTLKVIGDNTISIEAKHEENNEDGHIYRHLVRKYTLPKGYDINNIKSRLSIDGKLAITAPKLNDDSVKERVIPIEKQTEAEKVDGEGDKQQQKKSTED